MQFPALTGPGNSDHRAFAVAAKQFAGEQIIPARPMAALWILFRFQHLLHPKEKALVHDLGDTAFNTNVPVDINAGVSLIGE